MIALRRSTERGHFNHGWLNTYHTFSFGHYHDPQFVGFRMLRVINEDFVQGGQGFATHSHANMEIITYILEGALSHKDSLGTGSTIRPGEIQRMSAGTGISHSEFNASPTETCHLLQIWIHPAQKGLPPSYEQKAIARPERGLALLASPDSRQGSVKVAQDALLWAGYPKAGETVALPLEPARYGWLQVARGPVSIEGETLNAGDGAALSKIDHPELLAVDTSEFLFFDLA